MIRLSERQFPMLQLFIQLGVGEYMSIDEARQFDQRPFRSMLYREWIVYSRGHGFHITRAGREAWRDFHETSIARKNLTGPLTQYFDPTAYDLKIVARKKEAAA